jgi:hypothetical protein
MRPPAIHMSASPEEQRRHLEETQRYDEETARLGQSVIGMLEGQARTLVEQAGRPWQAVSPGAAVTMEVAPNRIRVVVVDRVVLRRI